MLRSTLELFFAAILWGFGYTATVWALQSFSSPFIIFARFAISFLLAAVFFALFWKKYKNRFRLLEFKLSFLPGILLSAMILLQTVGLEYTTATKSAFLTSLYAIMTPIMIFSLGKVNFHRSLWLWAGLSLVGVGMMVEFRFEAFNIGDTLTVIGAFLATLHFVVIGKIAQHIKFPFIFNFYQCFWSVITGVVCMVFWSTAPQQLEVSHQAIAGLLALAIFSTFVAFAIQLRAQKVLSETHAGLLCLLEAPFGLFFAMLILAEEHSVMQLAGCALIFASAVLATVFESRKGATQHVL